MFESASNGSVRLDADHTAQLTRLVDRLGLPKVEALLGLNRSVILRGMSGQGLRKASAFVLQTKLPALAA